MKASYVVEVSQQNDGSWLYEITHFKGGGYATIGKGQLGNELGLGKVLDIIEEKYSIAENEYAFMMN